MKIEDIKVFKVITGDIIKPIIFDWREGFGYIIEKNNLEIKITGKEISLEVFLEGDKVMLHTFLHKELGIEIETSRINKLLKHYGFSISVIKEV